ncbi:MAG: hypothetical protein WKF91_20665, partial [Segetibacter sp.]
MQRRKVVFFATLHLFFAFLRDNFLLKDNAEAKLVGINHTLNFGDIIIKLVILTMSAMVLPNSLGYS